MEQKAMEEAVIQAGARKVVVTETSAEQFVKEILEKSSELSHKFRTAISIEKEEPENYLEEAMARILEYAGQEGISPERTGELRARCMERADL